MGGMRLLPVLDVQDGVVVRGVGGRRHEYRPVVSRLTSSCRPVDVAEAFRAHFGLGELYLADLDALAGAAPALAFYRELRERGFRLWVDAGLRTVADAVPLAAAGIEGLVAGLETVAGPLVLADLCRKFGDRVVFSLDLKGGTPLGNVSAWGAADAASVAARAVEVGVRRLLVLDLARVGGGSGTGTEDLCRALTTRHPDAEVIAGGGVRDVADLERLRACGVSGVLVASALHDGRLTPEQVRDAQSGEGQAGRHS
jgi:phosphoribosylformimino-5-aminoimidazole carboxamide ribotide isomerase